MGDRQGSLENLVTLPTPGFWRGRRVLLTGHTGFKGSWLTLWLHRLGAELTGVALPPSTSPDLFGLTRVADGLDSRVLDLRDAEGVAGLVRSVRPEIVLHLAAQALVRAGYREPLDTFGTNVMGTANLLEAVRGCDTARVVVCVTSDKVYRDQDWPYPYRETDPLGGHDPYSASKAASELVAACYRDAFLADRGVALATARAGNTIGGGDWSRDRLIPDAVRAWSAGTALELRRPQAVRPWQHVIEALAGYLVLTERLWAEPSLAGPYNLGPAAGDRITVGELAEMAGRLFGGAGIRYPEATEGPHESRQLTLEVAKAADALGVVPRWPAREAVARTMAWYRAWTDGADARALCEADIADYQAGKGSAGGPSGPA